jgi:hypothetical protein
LKRFPFDSTQPFRGIISNLAAQCGGNVHKQGAVVISASSTASNQCYQVVDYSSTNYWFSNNEPNSWILFDFTTRRVSLTNYAIKSNGDSNHHLMQWSLEGSNNAESWIPLDRRNTQDLNGNYVVKSYACEMRGSSGAFFRYVRLIQTGASSSGDNYLMLSNLEFFGDVLESPTS